MILEAEAYDKKKFLYIYHKPLECAIRFNSYEIVCLLLYYGYYDQLFQSPLMFSISCKAGIEIQMLLLDYEDDLNNNNTYTSLLFEAIIHKSPIIIELIKRGANVNYFNGENNVISLALITGVEPHIFEMLWNKFDYNIWKETFSKSVMIKFLLDWNQSDNRLNVSYLKILIENEQKLLLDVEHHNNSYFWKSDNLISYLLQRCLEWEIPEQKTQSYVLHFLSYGAFIFQKNLDEFYSFSLNKNCDFLNILLYMDLMPNDNVTELSPMYFYYVLEPDLKTFLNCIWSNVILTDDYYNLGNTYISYLNFAMSLFSVPGNFCKHSLYELRTFLDPSNENFESFVQFPSLVQLSRDAARKTICSYFKIRNSCQLHNVVRYLDIQEYLKSIILYKKKIY